MKKITFDISYSSPDEFLVIIYLQHRRQFSVCETRIPVYAESLTFSLANSDGAAQWTSCSHDEDGADERIYEIML